jgi:hypothetical protein
MPTILKSRVAVRTKKIISHVTTNLGYSMVWAHFTHANNFKIKRGGENKGNYFACYHKSGLFIGSPNGNRPLTENLKSFLFLCNFVQRNQPLLAVPFDQTIHIILLIA